MEYKYMMEYKYIIVISILLFILFNTWKNKETMKISKKIDSAVNIGNQYVYLFKGNKCMKYLIKKNTLKKIKGFPKNISSEFKGINENIISSYLLEKKKLALLSSKKIYIYNLQSKRLEKTFTLKQYFNYSFFENTNSIIPFRNNQLIIFKDNRYGIYNKNSKKLTIHQISKDLPNFFNNIDAGINWGNDKKYDVFYFFKGLKEITYTIKKQSEHFKDGNIKGTETFISSKTWPNINVLLDINNKKNDCPLNYKIDSSGMYCTNKEGNKCSLYGNNKKFVHCKSICNPPFTSTGGIKYNEFVLFKVYPNNYLGNNEYPLQWCKDNVYIIEPSTGCVNDSSEKIVMWNDEVKFKNILTKQYLSLDNDNVNNVYKLIKPSENTANDKYISDSDSIKLCIIMENNKCINFFQNGSNDPGIIKVYRLNTVQNEKYQESNERLVNTDGTINFANLDDTDETKDSNEENIKDIDDIDDNESYCNLDGSDYRGTVNTTMYGQKCNNWNNYHQPITEQDNIEDGIDKHNYCRNPKQIKEKAWCYTNNDKGWEYCEIGQPDPKCTQSENNGTNINNELDNESDNEKCNSYIKTNDIEKYCEINGSDYRGTINWSSDNMQCEMWPTTYQNLKDATDKGIENHNFCRNPDNSQRPWCFVNDKENPVRFCNVGKVSNICNVNEDKELETYYTSDGVDYKGKQSITFKGNKCIPWNSSSLGNSRMSELNHNFCRNPEMNKKEMPWCYIKNGKWEYCNINKADNNDKNKNINKILCAFSIPEANVYYLFRNIVVNYNKYIIYNILSLTNHESLMIGIVNDITWPGLKFKEHIDAAYYYNNIIYFFNGSNILKYNININNKKKINHMKSDSVSIGFEFPNLDFKKGIDSIIDKGNGIVYMLQQNNYVIFDFKTGTQVSTVANQFNKDLIKDLNIYSIDGSVTVNNGICLLFKDNLFVEIENIESNQPKQINRIPYLIEKRYKLFWIIDINNPIFNKQKILVNKKNLLDNYKLINEIKNAGGLEEYITKKKTNVFAIAEKLDITLEYLSELIESGIFNKNMINKINTYNNPL